MKQYHQDESGDSLVTVALSLFVLLVLLALAVDVGFAYAHRRKMQNAADAAALAGAAVMMKGGSDAQILTAVSDYAHRNEAQAFIASYVPSGVLVGNGTVPGDSRAIHVIAQTGFPTFLAGLVGFDTMQADGEAAGGYTPLDIVLVLDRSGTMDDDTCSWKPYPPAGGRNCGSPLSQSTCTACYVVQSGVRVYGRWTPPPQPITDAKYAASAFVDMNNPNLTHLAAVSYADSSSLDRQLTNNFSSVKSSINGLTANGCTDAPGGLRTARNELRSSRSRPDALDFIVFLTDGLPNVAYGATICGGCPDYCPAAKAKTRDEANLAASQNIVIYTIALGSKADRALMQDVANITGGESFYAPTSADLLAIYQTIFERIQLRLIQ